jgi:hypothetical protein
MELDQTLKIVAVIITILTGLYSLFAPKKIKGFTGLEATTPRATTEIRAVREIYLTLAITYAAIALIRGVSMVLDKSMVRSNLISLVSEVVLVIVLVL